MPEVIKIPFAIPTRNTLDSMHRMERMRTRKQYGVFIRQQMSKYKIAVAKPGEKFTIRVKTFRKRRIRDHTNLIGGYKLMEDALTHEGFIWDDAEKYIGKPLIGQDVTRDEPYTLIERSKIE